MVKRFLVVVSLFTLAVGLAQAAPVTVDFSVIGADSHSITAPDNYTLDGVTFTYDNLGSIYDIAEIDALGPFGSTYGNLILDFDSQVSAINFDFSMIGVYGPVSSGVSVAFNNSGSNVGNLAADADDYWPYDAGNPLLGGDAYGTLSYSGAAFNQAVVSFSPDAYFFTVDSLGYLPIESASPEPSALAALAFGLLGIPALRLARRRR